MSLYKFEGTSSDRYGYTSFTEVEADSYELDEAGNLHFVADGDTVRTVRYDRWSSVVFVPPNPDDRPATLADLKKLVEPRVANDCMHTASARTLGEYDVERLIEKHVKPRARVKF